MGKLCVFLLVLLFYTIVNAGSGSHSLWAFVTYISGETPFPEFTVVLMLDDIQVGYFDSNIKHYIHKGYNASEETVVEETYQAAYIFGAMSLSLKERSSELKRFNSTEGIHVQQRLAGCEMSDNGEPALIVSRDIFNGIYADLTIYYNMTHYSYNSGNLLSPWSEVHQTYVKGLYRTIYLTICMETLKMYLEKEKTFIMRKVRPRVRLIQKAMSGGVQQMSCLAFGFYPRHINLTLLRDGQPIAEQELTGGQLLPNGDGTYQLRKTLEVSTEELRETHNYTCTASHLSLDNKLEVSWVPESGADRVYLSILPAALVMVSIIITICISICLRRRNEAGSLTLSQLSNTDDAQVAEQISLSSHSET
ncbi:patr class I histocompatibility antigen, A-5 alpha chain-like [Coregonus clupeaformis]|uniref:patr class I histocompatibility antigen, A-5 alpha chain-like n=1 Tax=Coregonus clupeaformis TaxID=59861 RepID=UPI001BDFEE8E|nr:patr class I histocompatibility antigen, A-5 alpha chain-like [Coregonus clupeaformis]